MSSCHFSRHPDVVFLFKQKTAYAMRISDWSSDVCSSNCGVIPGGGRIFSLSSGVIESTPLPIASEKVCSAGIQRKVWPSSDATSIPYIAGAFERSEEHTSELQSLMRISYAVFCLKTQKEIKRRRKTVTK